jgi:hypothetical protein
MAHLRSLVEEKLNSLLIATREASIDFAFPSPVETFRAFNSFCCSRWFKNV